MEHARSIRNRFVGVNVPPAERIASVVAGGALAALGMSRRSLGGAALATVGGALVARGVTGRCPAFRMRTLRKGIEVRRTVTIQAAPADVYALWRDLSNLPRFMHHVQAIEPFADGTSRWVVTAGGRRFSWRAELVEDVPAHRLRWRSLPGGDLDNEGSVELREAAGGRGTEVTVRLRYRPPGGRIAIGTLGGWLRLVSGIEIGEELARLRMLLETGELATGARRPADVTTGEKIAPTLGILPPGSAALGGAR